MNLADIPDVNMTTVGRPAVVLIIADPSHNGNGVGDGTIWNKRVTGCNIYLKNLFAASEGDSPNAWILQYSANFITGKLRVQSTQAEFDVSFNNDSDNQQYYY